MTRFIKTIKIYLGFLFLAFITKSCCETTYEIVGNGTIAVYDFAGHGPYDENLIPIISSPFTIQVRTERITIGSNYNINLINEAYATTCADNFENELLEDTIEYSFDREFVLNGNTVPADTNLRDINEITLLPTATGFGVILIRFMPEFIENATFEEENYQFKVKVNTNNRLELENTVELKFENQ